MKVRQSKYFSAARIALIFLLISVVYILLSDRLLLLFTLETADSDQLTSMQSLKGLVFVFLSSLVIFFLVQRETSSKRKYTRELESKRDELEIKQDELLEVIGKLKETQFALEQRNQFIEIILDNLPIGLAVNRISEGRATYMNQKFIDIYGWDESALKDIDSFFEHVFPIKKNREILKKQILSDIDSKDPRKMQWEGLEITTAAGDHKIVDARNIPLFDQDVMISTVQDVTARVIRDKEIQDYKNSLRELTAQLQIAEENQRKEIAGNIHDHLSQSLIISRMKLKDLMNRLDEESHTRLVSAVIGHLNETIENSRKITYDLSPPVLYNLGLTEAISWLTDKVASENSIAFIMDMEISELSLTDSKLILIYRSVQELIANIVKHASASEVHIRISIVGDTLQISIADNGCGFDKNEIAAKTEIRKSFGLFSVKERIHNLGGDFIIESAINKGTKATLSIPVN